MARRALLLRCCFTPGKAKERPEFWEMLSRRSQFSARPAVPGLAAAAAQCGGSAPGGAAAPPADRASCPRAAP